jgi:hypothetical protein
MSAAGFVRYITAAAAGSGTVGEVGLLLGLAPISCSLHLLLIIENLTWLSSSGLQTFSP